MGTDTLEDLPNIQDQDVEMISTPITMKKPRNVLVAGDDYPRIQTGKQAGNTSVVIVTMTVITIAAKVRVTHRNVHDIHDLSDNRIDLALSVRVFIQKTGLS